MSADKKLIAQMRVHLRNGNRMYHPNVFANIPPESWPDTPDKPFRRRVLRSRDFLVQVFERDGAIRLSINRTEINSDGTWKDGITWDEIQAVKKGCGYADFDAVEVFPRESDIVNVANIRHVWLVPPALADTLPFFWRNGKESSI